jgi:hypothetical protein
VSACSGTVGGVRGPVRRPLLQPGPAARVSRVPDRAAGAEQINDRRPELLREQSATAPHEGGVVVIDDSGDRKDGTATANVGRQWLGRLGKADNGIVTVTTVWTDGRVYYPLHTHPNPRPPLRPRPVRSGLPHESAAVRLPRGPREGCGLRLPGGGRRRRLLRQRRLLPRTSRGRPGLRGRAQAAPRHLGPGRPAAHSHRSRLCPDLEGRQEPR